MDDFLHLCKRFGQLDDLVQAGGGNISVKINDTISIIKSSGVLLSEVSKLSGYTIYDHTRLFEPLDNVIIAGPPPSMETFFHAFLYKYVVHVHPTTMLTSLCQKGESFIPYKHPGIELAREIKSRWKGETTIFLQNHGVIFTSNSLSELYEISHTIYEKYRTPMYVPLKLFWSMQDMFEGEYVYKVCSAETRMYFPILKQHNIRPITPDIVLFLRNSVHLEETYIFIHAPTKRKCLNTLEVLRSYCESIEGCATFLNELECADVLYSTAEQRRLAIA